MQTIGGWRFWLGLWVGMLYADVTHERRFQRARREFWRSYARTVKGG
jgi:hypothetical protein